MTDLQVGQLRFYNVHTEEELQMPNDAVAPE
jgi:hypothetical protein